MRICTARTTVVRRAIKGGLVDGTVLYTDSTHLKANANKNKYDLSLVAKSRADYLEALDEAVDADRAAHGKGPLKAKEHEPEVKETKVSRTDADSGYMVRDGKPKGFFYLDHRTVDRKHAIITDSFVTPGNVHDSIPYDRELDGYRCPNGQLLAYATTDRDGYRHYKSDPAQCRNCPLLASCTASANTTKVVTRHVWQDAKDHVDANRLTDWGRKLYARRKETVERSFADAKQLHGHRYARMRGLERVKEQCLLAAACQNIKKIALILARTAPGHGKRQLWRLISPLIRAVIEPHAVNHPIAAVAA